MKLVLALAASLALISPALACPNMDHDEAPKTADKKPAEQKPKQDQPKTDTAKQNKAPDTAKTKDTKEQKKPGDKVSMK
jgi:hypothetical protein